MSLTRYGLAPHLIAEHIIPNVDVYESFVQSYHYIRMTIIKIN